LSTDEYNADDIKQAYMGTNIIASTLRTELAMVDWLMRRMATIKTYYVMRLGGGMYAMSPNNICQACPVENST